MSSADFSPENNAEGQAENGSAAPQEEGLGHLLERLSALGRAKPKVSIHDIREEIGERSFGPFLLIPAVIEISPIGGIPGLPTVIAIVISLFAVQILFGRKHLWLPDFLEKRSFAGKTFADAMQSLAKPARYVDRIVRPRMRWATRPPWRQGIAAIVIALAATVPPLELIPFASTAPMAAIALFGLSLIARDGLVATFGALASVGGFGLLVWSLTNGR